MIRLISYPGRCKMLSAPPLALTMIALVVCLPLDLYGQRSQRVRSKVVQRPGAPVSVAAKPPELAITTYGTEDGLPLSSFYAAIKDRHGNLWFGTFGGGVSKYDGRSFQNFNTSHGLAHNVVSSILEDRYGDIWFGTLGGGVTQFDGITFRTFTTKNGLAQDMIRQIFEDSSGNLWFATMEAGVSRFDGKRFQNYSVSDGLPSNNTWCIAEDKKGAIYVGTDNGVSLFDGKRFNPHPALKRISVRSILTGPDGSIWYGTAGHGVFRSEENRLTQFTKEQGLSDNSIFTIIKDGQGKIWFGTEQGATVYTGNAFTSLTIEQGLTNNIIRAIVEDNAGKVWLATYGGGVNRYDGDRVAYYGPDQGIATSRINDVMEDDEGNLWFASHESGASKFDGKNVYHFTQESGLKTNSIHTIIQDRNKAIWFGTNAGGLSKLDGSTFTHFDLVSGLPNNTVMSLLEDTSGKLWIGTDAGLAVFDGKRFKSFTTQNGLANNSVRDILQKRDGTLWFATFGGGVSVYDGTGFNTYNETHGLSTNAVFAMLEDSKGNIWIGGMNGGLSRFDGKTFLTFKRSDGMPGEAVYDIVETESGELWIGTNRGLTRLSFLGKDDQEINAATLAENNSLLAENYSCRWQSYNWSTGYRIKDVNSGSMIFKRQNFPGTLNGKDMIWAGMGNNRIVRFAPFQHAVDFRPPVVALKKIMINDENVCWYDLQANVDTLTRAPQETLIYGHTLTPSQRDTIKIKYSNVSITGLTPFANLPTGLTLPHTANRLTFDYNAVQTSHYDLVNYQYKLEGQDADWGPPVKATQATYSNLWEGSYIFKVRAQSPQGVWSQPVAYRFTISPPWWRERWMFAVYALALCWLVLAFVKAIERRLRNEKRRLEKIVADRIAQVTLQTAEADAQREEAQKQKLEAERQRLLVEEKNNQIVKQLSHAEASLSNLTLQMIQRFHVSNELEQELRKLAAESNADGYQRAFSLIGTTRSLVKEWEQFDFYFSRVHKEFNTRLQENNQLSPYERRICALIKMGFENREIAMLLNIETPSVKMAKYRLKKKFQLDEKTDLQTYFESL